MTRIIQDSDEECEEEVLEEHVQNDTQAQDASSPHLVPEPAGTGSTESLRRAIQAAHHDQVHSIPSVLTPHDASPSFSLQTQSRNKRCKSSGEPPLNRSSGVRSHTKQPLKTYGRSKSLGSAQFPTSNPDPEQAGHDPERRGWELESTTRQDYAHHDPMTMFPEPSSTIPNTTLTQQRLLEEVTAANFLAIEAEVESEPVLPVYEPQKSSIPWSDYLKTPSEHAASQSEKALQEEQRSSHIENGSQHVRKCDPVLNYPTSSVGQTSRLSQPNETNSASRLKNSPSVTKVAEGDRSLQPSPSERRATDGTLTENVNIIHPRQEPAPSKGSLPHSLECEVRDNTLLEEPPRKRRKKSPMRASDDELEYLELPKEQYKPRPSRSRSLKTPLVEPVDYSVRPEKATRRRTRRSKTSDDVVHTAPSTPEKITQICDMGFTPSTTQKALDQNGGDVNQTVDWLVNNVDNDQDELAPPATSNPEGESKKKASKTSTKANRAAQENITTQNDRRRVSSEISAVLGSGKDPDSGETRLDHIVSDNASAAKELKSPVKVQVVIPRPTDLSSASGLDVQPSKMTTTNSENMADDLAEMTAKAKTDAPVTATQPKRRRGRPKKVAVELPVVQQNSLAENIGTDADQRNEGALSTIVDNQAKRRSPSVIDTPIYAPASTPPVKATEPPAAETKRTLESQSKQENDASTPLSRGKVSYRVGLSKRARITPLLRVVRK